MRLSDWRRSGRDGAPAAEEQPLRSELFSVDQLERHAATVAAAHDLARSASPDRLIARLRDNEHVLVQTYDLVTAAVAANRRISPAAEWLLDNFYLVEEQIRTARRHLPKSYGRELPRLAGGSLAGYPRVYAIAIELISHVDGRLDAQSLDAFVAAYQAVKPLKLGELWAVPIVLRLALIENLRRVSYDSEAAFGHAFKRYHGVAPGAYRQPAGPGSAVVAPPLPRAADAIPAHGRCRCRQAVTADRLGEFAGDGI